MPKFNTSCQPRLPSNDNECENVYLGLSTNLSDHAWLDQGLAALKRRCGAEVRPSRPYPRYETEAWGMAEARLRF